MNKQTSKKSARTKRQTPAGGAAVARPKNRKPSAKTKKPAGAASAKKRTAKQIKPVVVEPTYIEPASVPEPAAEPKIAPLPQPAWRRTVLIGGLSLVAVLALWLLGNLFFTRVQVGGVGVSGRVSDTALRALVQSQTAAYRLRLTYPNGQTKEFSLQDAGLQVDAPASVSAMRHAQFGWTHLLAWWRPVVTHVQNRVNTQAFAAFIARQATIVARPAQDASISLDDGNVHIKNSADGQGYSLSNASQTILNAATELRPQPLLLHNMPLQPEITAPELATTKMRLETILAQKIAITIDGQVVAPNASDIGNWLVLKPTSKTMDIAVDGDKVQAYLKQLASDHSHAARTQIALDGGSKIVQTGQRGVSVGDTQAAAAAIQQQALTGAGLSLTLPVTYTAFKTVSAPTAGKWIEVDTTTKHMYAYDQGELVRSFLVSAGAPATPTVTGSFAIYAKYRTQDMFGENVDGSNYFQPAVPYVNYFYRDYAIHGNYWRPASYFGHINSSHGCVGVPVDDGAWVYSWAPIGTPVIVHT